VIEVMKRAEGAARLGRLKLGRSYIPTPCVLSVAVQGMPAGEAYVAPAWVRTSRKPLVVHHGVFRGSFKPAGAELELLPQASARLSSQAGVVERWAERMLELAEQHPEHGVMLDGWLQRGLWQKLAERLSSRRMLGVAHAGELCSNPRLLVEVLTELRSTAATGTALYLPGVQPHMLPLLALMGGDVFDNSHAVHAALSGRYLTPLSTLEVSRLRLEELPCSCSACRRMRITGLSPRLLMAHNAVVFRGVLAELRAAMRERRLCELAEMLASASVEAKAALRLLYREKQQFLQRFHPVA